ncbi:MAG: hypothetical protein K8R41_10645 [Bacteroidales bacterium]|nr:hypothetical protein [Bacteroidales bacterium]
MDLQTRKLNLIEYLIRLQDENIFKIIEDTINKSVSNTDQALKPFTQDELIERAIKSNADYLAGNFKTQEQLEIEAKKW